MATSTTAVSAPVTATVVRDWRRRLTPVLLLAPGLIFLLVFFAGAMWYMLNYSFYSFESGSLTRDWSLASWQAFFTDPRLRSLLGRALAGEPVQAWIDVAVNAADD